MRQSLLGFFGAASLVAVLAGCWTAADAGVALAIWARMIAAWLVGLVIAIAMGWSGSRGEPRLAGIVPLIVTAIALLLLVACFADPGLQGVHRWIVVGAIRINAAAIVLPMMIVVLGQRAWAPIAMIAVLLLLVAQPDASQASGFAVAAIILLLAGKRTPVALASVAVVVVLGMIAWFRPDPLASVAEVEGIIALAWQRAPVVAAVAVVALALATAAPILAASRSNRATALALAAYMAGTAIAPAIGAFPVPLVGMSMSPIIGFWLGIGALGAQRQASRPQTSWPSWPRTQ